MASEFEKKYLDYKREELMYKRIELYLLGSIFVAIATGFAFVIFG